MAIFVIMYSKFLTIKIGKNLLLTSLQQQVFLFKNLLLTS